MRMKVGSTANLDVGSGNLRNYTPVDYRHSYRRTALTETLSAGLTAGVAIPFCPDLVSAHLRQS